MRPRTTVLFASPLVRIEDVRCRSTRFGAAPEEWSPPGFAVVRAGVFRKHLGRNEVLADWNHAVFFNSGEAYRVSHPLDGGDDCTFFSLSEEGASFPLTHALLPTRALLLDFEIRRLCRNGGGSADPIAVESRALELLDIVTGSASRTGGTPPGPPRRPGTRREHRLWSEGARFHLASHFDEPIRLGAIAAAVGCSPFHLARIFSAEVGLPMHRYLTRLRLKAALLRLAEGERDLTRLGLDVGFSSHSHFTTAFRRETGLTPSACRRDLSAPRLREMSKNLKA